MRPLAKSAATPLQSPKHVADSVLFAVKHGCKLLTVSPSIGTQNADGVRKAELLYNLIISKKVQNRTVYSYSGSLVGNLGYSEASCHFRLPSGAFSGRSCSSGEHKLVVFYFSTHNEWTVADINRVPSLNNIRKLRTRIINISNELARNVYSDEIILTVNYICFFKQQLDCFIMFLSACFDSVGCITDRASGL